MIDRRDTAKIAEEMRGFALFCSPDGMVKLSKLADEVQALGERCESATEDCDGWFESWRKTNNELREAHTIIAGLKEKSWEARTRHALKALAYLRMIVPWKLTRCHEIIDLAFSEQIKRWETPTEEGEDD